MYLNKQEVDFNIPPYYIVPGVVLLSRPEDLLLTPAFDIIYLFTSARKRSRLELSTGSAVVLLHGLTNSSRSAVAQQASTVICI